jgi:hypothetical protein
MMKIESNENLNDMINQPTEAASELSAMAREAAAKAIIDRIIASRKGDAKFQSEQNAENEKQLIELAAQMSKIEFQKFKEELKERLEDADNQEEEAETQQYIDKLVGESTLKAHTYKLSQKLEYSLSDSTEKIVPKSRNEYVFYFKAQQRRTARATLEMCRTVYEAEQILREGEFESFCKDVGYEAGSSTIRKFAVIGKVYPRLIDFAESLPVAWTNIYLLTQIPADDFERCIEHGFAFNKLSAGELKALVDKTKDLNNVVSPFKYDRKEMAYPVAKVFFTKRPDDTDFRLLEKALAEVQARLPVKFQMIGEQVRLFKDRAAQRYEKIKQEGTMTAVKPSQWDYGSAANEVHLDKKSSAA